ncbi:transcription elongation factor GreA, partial [Lactobacillus crispatus JV-V01]
MRLWIIITYKKIKKVCEIEMVYFQKMTPEGYQQIEDEIARLKKDRPRRIKILQAARALGDLSENTEYTEAKRDLGHLQSRLRYLGKQLKY